MNYSELTDEELYKIMDESDLAGSFLKTPMGLVLQEAAKRIVDQAVFKIAMVIDPKDVSAIWEQKLIIRKYKYGLFEEINQLSREGVVAYSELTARYGELDPAKNMTG